MSVGEPENKNDYEVYSEEDVIIYLAVDFPRDLPKIIIQLKKNLSNPPRLVASRRS